VASSLVVLLAFALCGTWGLAQDKVAEGECLMHGVSESGAPLEKTAIRWILYSKSTGGYHLQSDIQNLPKGIRVSQVEEFDARLIPTVIGYEFYRKDQQKPSITMKCQFVRDSVTCSGQAEDGRATASKPHKHRRPFLLAVRDLAALDVAWLLGGGVNMAHPETGKATVSTITVAGGVARLLVDAVNLANLEAVRGPGTAIVVPGDGKNAQWDFSSDEEEPVEFVGTETVEIGGTKVAARHYILQSGDEPMNLWMAGIGLPVKLSGAQTDEDLVLTNYKQYKKLIPEIRIEDQRPVARP
jgi:hypothetical protein